LTKQNEKDNNKLKKKGISKPKIKNSLSCIKQLSDMEMLSLSPVLWSAVCKALHDLPRVFLPFIL
jgi:hypothetical protein